MVRGVLQALLLAGLTVGVWFLAEWLFDDGDDALVAGRLLATALGLAVLIRLIGVALAALRPRPIPTLAETPLASEPDSFSGRFQRFWREPIS